MILLLYAPSLHFLAYFFNTHCHDRLNCHHRPYFRSNALDGNPSQCDPTQGYVPPDFVVSRARGILRCQINHPYACKQASKAGPGPGCNMKLQPLKTTFYRPIVKHITEKPGNGYYYKMRFTGKEFL